jgi:hypothetical protein
MIMGGHLDDDITVDGETTQNAIVMLASRRYRSLDVVQTNSVTCIGRLGIKPSTIQFVSVSRSVTLERLASVSM